MNIPRQLRHWQHLEGKYKGVQFDVQTTAGLKSATEARSDLRGYRVSLEKLRKEIKAPALDRCRLIDEEAKSITAALVALEAPIDQQIKTEEARKEAEKLIRIEAERARLATIHAKLQQIRDIPITVAGKTSADIGSVIKGMEHVDTSLGTFQEYHAEAIKAYSGAIDSLTIMQIQTEANEVEQERIRQEQEAEAARLAAEREELARLRAEAEARDAELKALRDAENARIRAEHEAETEARRVHNAAVDAERAAAQAIIDEANAAESERIRAEQAEKDRLQQIEEERLAAERAEFERVKREQEKEEARLAEERLRIKAEKKAADERRNKLAKSRRDTPAAALADILAICQNHDYSDAEARNDIELIAESSL